MRFVISSIVLGLMTGCAKSGIETLEVRFQTSQISSGEAEIHCQTMEDGVGIINCDDSTEVYWVSDDEVHIFVDDLSDDTITTLAGSYFTDGGEEVNLFSLYPERPTFLSARYSNGFRPIARINESGELTSYSSDDLYFSMQ